MLLAAQVLSEKRIGVVAHFYMDPEVQGVLSAAQEHWPHIHISDSLVMADSAVAMAEAGCQAVLAIGIVSSPQTHLCRCRGSPHYLNASYDRSCMAAWPLLSP